jgi:Carboxypeptidase regulatory-like domain
MLLPRNALDFIRVVCASAAFSAIAFAQPPGSGVISGSVVESSNNEASNNDPVRKALVTLTWQGTPRSWATSRTDSSGQFKFEGLPPGKYDLRAAKAGAGAAIYGASSVRELGELIMLEDGEIRAGVKLRFLHSATISGRVLDPHGDPATNIRVTLLKPVRNLGERALVRYRDGSTNDRGEYRFDDVAPGQYCLHAQQPPEFGGAEPLIQQFFGGGRDSKDATFLTVHGDEALSGIDFHMTSGPAVQIHGRVTGVPDTWRGPGGITISLWTADEYVDNYWGSSLTTEAPDYSFNFDLRPGRYGINAEVEIEGKSWTAWQYVDTSHIPGDIALALAPPLDLKGKLRIEGNAGNAGNARPPASSFNIRLTRRGLGPRISADAAADGTFILKQVPPGEWLLNVNPLPPGAFLKVARLGDQDIRFARMEIRPGSEDPVNIVVSMNTAQVHGQVDAGSGGQVDAGGGDSKRAGILLAPIGLHSTLTRFFYDVAADDTGKFELKDIAPGKYKIFALEKLAPAEFKTPEAASQLDPLGQEIELAEGASLEVHPKLIPIERAREAIP